MQRSSFHTRDYMHTCRKCQGEVSGPWLCHLCAEANTPASWSKSLATADTPLKKPRHRTNALPGTIAKMDIMSVRLAKNQSCFHPLDAVRNNTNDNEHLTGEEDFDSEVPAEQFISELLISFRRSPGYSARIKSARNWRGITGSTVSKASSSAA